MEETRMTFGRQNGPKTARETWYEQGKYEAFSAIEDVIGQYNCFCTDSKKDCANLLRIVWNRIHGELDDYDDSGPEYVDERED